MRWLVLTTMVFFAATCGQKGPLTHPEPKASSGIERLLVGHHAYAPFKCPASAGSPPLTNGRSNNSHG